MHQFWARRRIESRMLPWPGSKRAGRSALIPDCAAEVARGVGSGTRPRYRRVGARGTWPPRSARLCWNARACPRSSSPR
jgi:hypothetical protein